MPFEVLFFVIAFAFSWVIWLAVAAVEGELSLVHEVAVGVAAAGPSLAGVLCTALGEGGSGVRRLLGSLLQWRMAARWYVLSLGGPLALALTAVAFHRILIGSDARFRLEPSTVALIPPALIAGLLIGSLQEELGWRGFALPRLLRRWGSLRAALVLGVAWACWHVPLYAIETGGQERMPLSVFLFSVIALSVLYTWFWAVTGGRLVVALLLHSATNVAGVLLLKDARGDFGPAIIAMALTIALAGAAARDLRRKPASALNAERTNEP